MDTTLNSLAHFTDRLPNTTLSNDDLVHFDEEQKDTEADDHVDGDEDDGDILDRADASHVNFGITNPRRRQTWLEMMQVDPDVYDYDHDGIWVECKYCFIKGTRKRIISRNNRPYSKERWMEHKRSTRHGQHVNLNMAKEVVTKKCVGLYHKKQELLYYFCLYGSFSDLQLEIRFNEEKWALCATNCLMECTVEYAKEKCCENCSMKKKDIRIYKRLSRMKNIEAVDEALQTNFVSDEQMNCLIKFAATTTPRMNARKRKLIERAKEHIQFVKWFRQQNAGINEDEFKLVLDSISPDKKRPRTSMEV